MPRRFKWPWPFPGGSGKKEPPFGDESLSPVLLIPGIAGSILNAVSKDNKTVERVWVRLLEADAEFRKRLWSEYDPSTGRTEALDQTIEIQVPDDRFGLYSCDILDPDLRFRLDAVYYYHDMIAEMVSWGYVEGKTLFGFGYDFRQSNRLPEQMLALRTKLEIMYELAGHRKVNIITHSMGGLLVKSFMALHPQDCSKYVDKWITIATPFRGAPGFIVDCLLTGVEFLKGWSRDLFIAKWSMHQLVQECPSIYEMLPPADFPWKKPPVLQLWVKGENNGDPVLKTYEIPEWCDILREALKDNTMDYNGVSKPLPLSEDIVSLAEDTRTLWSSAELPKGVKFYNIYGKSLDTPFDTCYGTKEAPLGSLKDALHTDAIFQNLDGDGTVPVESSTGDGFEAVERVAVDNDHRGILRDAHTFNAVKSFLGVGPDDPLYDPHSDYVIVPPPLDVQEMMLVDEMPRVLLRGAVAALESTCAHHGAKLEQLQQEPFFAAAVVSAGGGVSEQGEEEGKAAAFVIVERGVSDKCAHMSVGLCTCEGGKFQCRLTSTNIGQEKGSPI